MSSRIRTSAILMALAAGVSAQSINVKSIPGRSGSDPFSIDRGTSFSASGSSKNKSSGWVTTSSVASDVEEAFAIVRKNHVDGPAPAGLARTAIDSMLKSLDPHSNYYDRAEFKDLLSEQNSEYFGTGSTIAEYERGGKGSTYIVSTFPGSSAEKAGLRFGDRIVAVDGRSTEQLGYSRIRDLMRGPKGSSVSVTVERGSGRTTVILKRDRVPQRTVTDFYMLGSGVGFIRMTDGFSFSSYSEFDTAFRQLKAQGMTSLVYDLRGNPGGILDQSVKIAEKFLPEGSLIVTQRGRSAFDNRVWRSANRTPETLPVVVLVDEESASAAEIVAGALQDNDRAAIVGLKTFGKGLVQSVLDIPAGGGLALTTARYFTPSGRSLQRDYVHSGNYDYYNPSANTAVPSKPSLTRGKRKVFGGDGITPDVIAPSEPVTQERLELIDPLFLFVRGMVESGNFTPDGPAESAFREFAMREWGMSESQIDRNIDFIRLRLRHDLAMATGGPTAASRVLMSHDPQLAKAVDAMPQAVSFASSYQITRNPAKQ